jgi:adenine-specific DNA-methyltransferase
MLYECLVLMRDLLANTGSIYLHVGGAVSEAVKLVMDEVFGVDAYRNQVIWQRTGAHNDPNRYGIVHDSIYYYTKSASWVFNKAFTPYDDEYIAERFRSVEEGTGRRFWLNTLTGPAHGSPGVARTFFGVERKPPPGTVWRFTQENIDRLIAENRIVQTGSGMPYIKQYLDESPGRPIQSIWSDIPMSKSGFERLGYDTQKPEGLLERIVAASSNPGDLVCDFFLGSGTTVAVAEKLGRRWIGCDLGRFAIQTSRKRLLDMRAKPFEVLNLGRYERRYWQGATAGEAIGEYYRFIVELFHGEVIPGFAHLHGVKAGHLIHVGATDAPITERELHGALEECKANGFTDLDALGWEWEMGLNREGPERLAREYGVKLRLFNIPREVMDKRAVDAGDVHFFELSVADLQAHVNKNEAVIELCGFLPAIDDYMRKKVGDADLKWSDWIDYWSVDFEYDGETFINQWQSYRTRKNRTLALRSDPHRYEKSGEYRVVVKVIDIFGNDTTQQLTVEIPPSPRGRGPG